MSTIKEIRVARSISQTELARRAGVYLRTVQSVENGKPVQKRSAEAVCRALGIELSEVENINYHDGVQASAKRVGRRKNEI